MSAKLTVKIKPPADVAQRLASHHNHSKTKGPTTKMRRTAFAWGTPLTGEPVNIVLNQPGESTSSKEISYTLTLRLPSILTTRSALVENTLFKPATCIVPLFRAALLKELDDLPEDLLAPITADHCHILEVTGTYYIEFSTEGEAFQVLCALHKHGLVILNSADPYPATTGRGKANAPRLRAADGETHAIYMDLMHLPAQEKFGELKVYLMRSLADQPQSFASQPPKQREELRATARRILCLDITVDVSKNLHFGRGKDFQLPFDYRQWTKDCLPEDPFRVIWEAMRYALALNLSMPTDDSSIDISDLDQGAREVLEDYFLGRNLYRNDWVDGAEGLLRFRKQLLEAVHIDVLIPWAIAKLNLCEELGEQLAYEKCLHPSKVAELQEHCLAFSNAEAKVDALLAMLPELATTTEPLLHAQGNETDEVSA